MKLTRILITILLTISINFSIINPSNALYTEDLTITGTNGIWTDVRSYISLSDAIAAIGSKQQTLLIPTEVTCSNLTIPSNITLKFVKTGAINNSGTLTIQTTNIIAGHNQIFTGSGSINFADNTEVLSSWFPSLYNAINQTSNDKVCLIIDKQYTLSTSISLGNDIVLKFSSPVSTISTNSNVTLSNISKVISSKGIIFTGSGDFDFTKGSIIHTSWFTSFRRAVTYTFDDNVLETLLLDSDGSLDTDVTINSYTTLKVLKSYPITIPSGLTLTIDGDIDAGNYQIFSGDGDIVFSDNSELKSSWFSSFETAIAKINSAKVILIVTSSATISNDCTVNNNISLSIPYPNRVLTISSGKTLTINGLFSAGIYQVFSGDGSVSFGDEIVNEAYPEWWGIDGIADNIEINKAIESNRRVSLQGVEYSIADSINLENNTTLFGKGNSTILKASSVSDGFPFIIISGKHGVILRDFVCDGNEANRTLTPGVGNGCVFIQSGSHDNLVENIEVKNFGDDTGNGNFITISVTETDAEDSYNNTIRNCVLIDTNKKSKFGIRLWTDWTEPIASDAYTRFVRDNTVENCRLIGFTWNAVEIAGPATVHNSILNNVSINHAGHSCFESDKGARYNKFICNVAKDIVAGERVISAFRDQGVPADGGQPERFATGNLYIGNSVNGMIQTDAYGTIGFYAVRSKNCTVTDFNVSNITGTGSRCAAFYIDTVNNLIINNSQVKDVQTGVFFVNGCEIKNVIVNGGNYNVVGSFLCSGGHLGTREGIVVSDANIKTGATAFMLTIEEILISNNFITGSEVSNGIYGSVYSAKGIFSNNIIKSFATGIVIKQDNQIATGNLFIDCDANFSIGNGLRSTVYANIGDGSASRAPMITYGTAAPTTGTYLANDIVLNINATAGGTIGWICTTGGTPGTWKTFGSIAP